MWVEPKKSCLERLSKDTTSLSFSVWKNKHWHWQSDRQQQMLLPASSLPRNSPVEQCQLLFNSLPCLQGCSCKKKLWTFLRNKSSFHTSKTWMQKRGRMFLMVTFCVLASSNILILSSIVLWVFLEGVLENPNSPQVETKETEDRRRILSVFQMLVWFLNHGYLISLFYEKLFLFPVKFC